MKVKNWKLISCVQLFATPWNSPWNSPGQNTGVGSHSLLQGDLPNPGIKPRSPSLQADSLPTKPPGKPKNTGVGSLSLLQGIFLTQESNRGLLHRRQILYQLNVQGSYNILSTSDYLCFHWLVGNLMCGGGLISLRSFWKCLSPISCVLKIPMIHQNQFS